MPLYKCHNFCDNYNMKEQIRHFKEIVHYRKNVRAAAEMQSQIDQYYLSEQDPVGLDFVSGDIYIDGLYQDLEAKKAEKRDCEG